MQQAAPEVGHGLAGVHALRDDPRGRDEQRAPVPRQREGERAGHTTGAERGAERVRLARERRVQRPRKARDPVAQRDLLDQDLVRRYGSDHRRRTRAHRFGPPALRPRPDEQGRDERAGERPRHEALAPAQVERRVLASGPPHRDRHRGQITRQRPGAPTARERRLDVPDEPPAGHAPDHQAAAVVGVGRRVDAIAGTGTIRHADRRHRGFERHLDRPSAWAAARDADRPLRFQAQRPLDLAQPLGGAPSGGIALPRVRDRSRGRERLGPVRHGVGREGERGKRRHGQHPCDPSEHGAPILAARVFISQDPGQNADPPFGWTIATRGFAV